MIARGLAGLGVVGRRVAHAWRAFVVRVARPGVTLGADARLGAGVELRATDGGSLRIGRRCRLGDGVQIHAQGGRIEIGDDVFIGPWTVLTSKSAVALGDDCLVAERVSIRDQDHRIHGDPAVPIRAAGFASAPIAIGRNVWIAAGAVVLRGVRIGDGAVVAANAVVTGDVDGGTIVGGAPARFLRRRGGGDD